MISSTPYIVPVLSRYDGVGERLPERKQLHVHEELLLVAGLQRLPGGGRDVGAGTGLLRMAYGIPLARHGTRGALHSTLPPALRNRMGICGTRPRRTHLPVGRRSFKERKGCFYANFKPDRGNYTEDGNLITSRVGQYGANDNGLFDMAGNVAEWTNTVFTEAGVQSMADVNPELRYEAAKEDPYFLKRKSVRGGSWKDPQSYIRSAWRTWEYQTSRVRS